METPSKPIVYSYSDYRKYLADHYAYAKASEYGFSFRAFSQRAGLRSTNYLKLVIDGQRNLSPEMAERFARGCGLSGDRVEFFCELVSYCQAETVSERNRGYERLYRFRPFRAVHQLAKEQAEYHSQWYLPAIRELLRRPDFREEPDWIAAQLSPKISPALAEKALATLLKLGLIERSAESGALAQTSELVTTGSGPLGHHIYSYHHMMLERASHALDHLPREERDISCLTLCVSQAKLEELKQRVRAFRQELLQAAEIDNAPQRVVQINFQVFPLSAPLDGPESSGAAQEEESP